MVRGSAPAGVGIAMAQGMRRERAYRCRQHAPRARQANRAILSMIGRVGPPAIDQGGKQDTSSASSIASRRATLPSRTGLEGASRSRLALPWRMWRLCRTARRKDSASFPLSHAGTRLPSYRVSALCLGKNMLLGE